MEWPANDEHVTPIQSLTAHAIQRIDATDFAMKSDACPVFAKSSSFAGVARVTSFLESGTIPVDVWIETAMSHGFLGYDGSTFMLDFVVTALVLIVPALLVSLYLVKVRRNYVAHRNLQLALAGVLLLAVIAFEIDIRAHGGWRAIVGSRQSPLSAEQLETAKQTLYVHLVFAISTPLLWGTTIALALKRMPKPPAPCEHSQLHKTLGWLSVIDLVLTSVTGLLFYYRAFIT